MGRLTDEHRMQRQEIMQKLLQAKDKPSIFAEFLLGETLFDYNVGYADSDERYIIYRAGGKVGKTTSTAIKALHFAIFAPFKHPICAKTRKCEIIIVAPTQSQANIMFDTIKTYAHRNKLIEGMIKRETASQLEIFFINGMGLSKIYTRAAGERGDSLRGYIPHVIVIDEAAFVKFPVFKALLPRGAATQAKVWLISTPFGRQGYFYEKAMEARSSNPAKYPHTKPDGRWIEFRARTSDNPLVKNDPDFLEEIKLLTKDEATMELDGEFVDFGDALFPHNLLLKAIGDWHLPDELTYYLGCDVARKGKDETVYTVVAVDRNDNVYIVDQQDEAQSNLVDVAARIGEFCRRYPIETAYVDETALGGGVVDIAKRNGLPVVGIVFSKKRKSEMYRKLRVLFEDERIRINRLDKFTNKLLHQLSYMRREYQADGIMKVLSEDKDDYSDSFAVACEAVSGIDEWHALEGSEAIFG